MRWEQLFADLESAFAEAARADLAAEVADRSRAEVGRLRLVDRLRAAAGSAVHVSVTGFGGLSADVVSVGPDWLLLAEPTGRQSLLALAALESVRSLGDRSAAPGSEGAVGARFGLPHALRGLARDRAVVAVTLRGGSNLTGTVDRVGADFVEIAEHEPEDLRRAGAVRTVQTIPIAQLALLRSR